MIISPYIDTWYDHRTDEERKADRAEYNEYRRKHAKDSKIGLAGGVDDLRVKKIKPAIVSNFLASAQNLGGTEDNWYDDNSFYH